MNSVWFWLKYNKLKRAFAANRAMLFDATHLGDSNIALGNIVLLRDSRYHTTVAGEGASAWRAIVEKPKAVSAALTCNRCGFCHVIQARHGGVDALLTGAFGRFDRYQGMWQSSWFRLVAPIVQNALGMKNQLVCQRCKVDDVPKVRLY